HTGLVVVGEMGGGSRQEGPEGPVSSREGMGGSKPTQWRQGPSGPARTQSRQQLAMGETPNVAARIQGLAAPDTVVMGPTTFRLVRGYFTWQDLGTHTLKGLAAPLQVYRVLGESAAQSRLDVAGATGFTPLVGRDSEVALLLERWAQSQAGAGQ